MDSFKFIFHDILIDQIVKTINEYECTNEDMWETVDQKVYLAFMDGHYRKEFIAFIDVILNIGTMLLASISEYWTTRSNSRIPFYSEIFRRVFDSNFLDIISMRQCIF